MVTQTQSQAASRAFSRVGVTDAAAALLRQLTEQYGPLMFHQSGGCCDGSAPMCYPVGMFITGPSDVHLGTLEVGPVSYTHLRAHET